VDQSGLLSVAEKSQLENSIFQFKQSHQAQIQVFIVKSLDGDAIESVAIKVFDKWKLGDEKRDDGVLLLIAPSEKRLRIEVGQGLEGTIPDVIAKRIVADVIRPYFQRGEFFVGTQMGVSAIQNAILAEKGLTADQAGAQNPAQSNVREPRTTKKPFNNFVFLGLFGIWLIIFLISPRTGLEILFFALARGGGGGRSSGGSWGGGGGRSSGGGASGDW